MIPFGTNLCWLITNHVRKTTFITAGSLWPSNVNVYSGTDGVYETLLTCACQVENIEPVLKWTAINIIPLAHPRQSYKCLHLLNTNTYRIHTDTSGLCFNIKTVFLDKQIPCLVMRPSYLYHWNSYTGKLTSFYWDSSHDSQHHRLNFINPG